MSRHFLFIAVICRWLAALGAFGGLCLMVALFNIPLTDIAAYKSRGMMIASMYLFSIGGLYVFVSNQLPEAARLSGSKVNIFAGLPNHAQRIAIGIAGLALVAFFVTIGFVESGRVPHEAGEVAILGAACVGVFTCIFSGCWSAERYIHENA